MSASSVRRTLAEFEVPHSQDVAPIGIDPAEIPVITTTDAVGRPWQERTFWRIAACLPALLLAWPAARGTRRTAREDDQAVVRLSRPVRRGRGPTPTVVVTRRNREPSGLV
jgi:hypothetical protein